MTNKTRSGYIPVKVGHNKKIKIFDRFTSVKKQSKRVLNIFFFAKRKEHIRSNGAKVSEIKSDRRISEINKKIKEAKKTEIQSGLKQKDTSAVIPPDLTISEKYVDRKPGAVIEKDIKPPGSQKKNRKLLIILVLLLILIAIAAFFLVNADVFNKTEIATSRIDENRVTAAKPAVSDIVRKINNTKIYFHPNSDKLLMGELPKLDLIISHLNESSGDVLIIMGHEHKVGLGISQGVLSKNRAIRIKNILLSKCSVKPNVKIEFYGNKKLAIINARRYDEKIKNRRVEFRITASE